MLDESPESVHQRSKGTFYHMTKWRLTQIEIHHEYIYVKKTVDSSVGLSLLINCLRYLTHLVNWLFSKISSSNLILTSCQSV